MDQRAAERVAAELVRIIVGYDGRDDADQFTVTAFASGVKRNPHLTREDWHQGIEDWYLRPDATRIKIGDLVATAKAAHGRRIGSHTFELERGKGSPKPANFDQMKAEMQEIVRDFQAEGISPTNDDVLTEWAKRNRAQTA